MRNQPPSRRKARYLPPWLHHKPGEIHPAQLVDASSTWSIGLVACERCGEPNYYNPEEKLLTKVPCPGCGKYPWANTTFFVVTFLLYWITVIVWLLGGGSGLWRMPGDLVATLSVIGGFLGYILVFLCVAGLRAMVLKRRIRRKISQLEIQRSQNPGNVELLGKLSSLYSFLLNWEDSLAIAEEALRLNPENHLIKGRVDYARAAVSDPLKALKDSWHDA